MSDGRDDAKKLVLARRARFVAAALAGMTVACGKEQAPHPCLEVAPPEDAATAPQPCLSQVRRPEVPDGAPPQPCLSQVWQPAVPDAAPPTPCLKPTLAPTDAGAKKDATKK